MPEPELSDLRNIMKEMSVDYKLKGNNMLLSLKVEFRATSGFSVNLKSSLGMPPQVQQIGSKVFRNHSLGERMPKTIWLLLDMAHLIMLLAKRTKAERDVMKVWFQEAKDFLAVMEENISAGLRF